LPKELSQSVFVLPDIGIKLRVGAFQIGIGYDSRPAMAWSGDVDHIQAVFLDDPVEMNVDEIEPGSRTPMTQKPGFDMLNFQRFTKQWIPQEVDLSDGKIIGGTPVGINLPYVIRGKRLIRGQLRGIHGSQGAHDDPLFIGLAS